MISLALLLVSASIDEFPNGRVSTERTEWIRGCSAAILHPSVVEVWPASDRRLLELAGMKDADMTATVVSEALKRNSKLSPAVLSRAMRTNPRLTKTTVEEVCQHANQFNPTTQWDLLRTLQETQINPHSKRVARITRGLAGDKAIAPALVQDLALIDEDTPRTAKALGCLQYRPAIPALKVAQRKYKAAYNWDLGFLLARAHCDDADAETYLGRLLDSGWRGDSASDALQALARPGKKLANHRLKLALERGVALARTAVNIIAQNQITELRPELEELARKYKGSTPGKGAGLLEAYAKHVASALANGSTPLKSREFNLAEKRRVNILRANASLH